MDSLSSVINSVSGIKYVPAAIANRVGDSKLAQAIGRFATATVGTLAQHRVVLGGIGLIALVAFVAVRLGVFKKAPTPAKIQSEEEKAPTPAKIQSEEEKAFRARVVAALCTRSDIKQDAIPIVVDLQNNHQLNVARPGETPLLFLHISGMAETQKRRIRLVAMNMTIDELSPQIKNQLGL